MLDLTERETMEALSLTTARGRMQRRAGVEGLQSGVEDVLEPERYSVLAEVGGLVSVAYTGVSFSFVSRAAQARRDFRQLRYSTCFSLVRHRDNDELTDGVNPNSSYKSIKLKSPKIIIYNLNRPKCFEKSIEQIVKCYCVFVRDPNVKLNVLDIAEREFYSFLLHEIDFLMEEYYQVVHQYPNMLLTETLTFFDETARNLAKDALAIFERVFELCINCGSGCESKADLMMHIETKSCIDTSTHRCQCMKVFNTHLEWSNHWLKTNMTCGTMSWHLWKNMSRSNNDGNMVYKCDGCQHLYVYFMKYWNHICYCPFFRVYLLTNCQFCNELCKINVYNESCFQDIIQKHHSDKVGIKILKEWSQITTVCFKVRLAVPDDQKLFKSIMENEKAIEENK